MQREQHVAAEAGAEKTALLAQRTSFLRQKAASYTQDSAALQARLREAGFHRGLSHTAIVEQAEV